MKKKKESELSRKNIAELQKIFFKTDKLIQTKENAAVFLVVCSTKFQNSNLLVVLTFL